MKNILIAVVGTTPAVITETLQALADRSIEIDEMHIVTTSVGKKLLFDTLLGKNRPFRFLCREYPGSETKAKIAEAILKDDNCHVVMKGKVPLRDIEKDEDAIALADLIGTQVRALAADKNARLFASLAGGRKTMSFWLGCAMSLFARPRDRLMHVLVNAPFENCDDFFYKPHTAIDLDISTTIPGTDWRKGGTCNTGRADIALGYVPFPQFWPRVKETRWGKLDTQIDMGRVIAELNAAENPVLTFEDDTTTVQVENVGSIKLQSAQQYALWKFCAEVAAGKFPPGAMPAKRNERVLIAEDFISNGQWASKRLAEILFGDEKELAQELKEWDPFTPSGKTDRLSRNERLWLLGRDYAAARGELTQAKNEKKRAKTEDEAARAKLAKAENAFRNAEEDRADLSGKLDEARRKGLAASRFETRLKVAERRLSAAEEKRSSEQTAADASSKGLSAAKGRFEKARANHATIHDAYEADPNKQAIPIIVKRVTGLTKAIGLVRKHLGDVLDREIQDEGLRDLLKLTHAGSKKKPAAKEPAAKEGRFQIGLNAKFHEPDRIKFLP